MKTPDTAFTAMPNLLARVHRFNAIGQVTPPGHFNADRVGFYTGMQLEEMAEKIMAIAQGHVVKEDRLEMAFFADALDSMGKAFKAGKHYGAVLRADREEMLDGDIDILVVSAGALIYQTPKFAAAVECVLAKNDEKIPNGKATHDSNGKLLKPAGWTPPDLSPFVDVPDNGNDSIF